MKIHSLLYLLKERLLWYKRSSEVFWRQDFDFSFCSAALRLDRSLFVIFILKRLFIGTFCVS